jgi:hypothetical protein
MTHDQIEQHRTDLLAGRVTPAFYQAVYLPYAHAAQTRTVEALQRVSRGKVTASVLLGAKQAATPLSYRVLADSVAVMSVEQLNHFIAQYFCAYTSALTPTAAAFLTLTPTADAAV